MLVKFGRLILLVTLILATHIEAKSDTKTVKSVIEKAQNDLPPQCIFFFKMYLNAKKYKAFAIATDKDKKYTCRFSSQASSQKKANEVALKSCQKSRKKRGIKGECRLYNIDIDNLKSKKRLSFEEKYLINLKKIKSKIAQENKKTVKVEKKSTPKPQKAPADKREKSKKSNSKSGTKEQKKRSKKSKAELIKAIDLTKIKTVKKSSLDILPVPCHMFYKLYEDAPEFKAFAFAVDDQKRYVCKFSAKNSSKERAKKTAIYSCRKTKKKRKVDSECKLFELIQKHHLPPAPQKRKQAKEKTQVAKKVSKPKKHRLTALDRELQRAILDVNLAEIKRLIKAGADVNTVAPDRSRALFVAVAKGDVAFTKELLKRGANPYFRTRDGNNLLVAAIMSGKPELLEMMLKLNISPNKRCEEGNTPLHFAFMMFDDKMMRLLYRYGARDDIKNGKGKTVQDLAKELHFDLKKIKRSIYR